MKSLSIIFIITLALGGATFGQTVSDTAANVRQIKMLESTRDDVKRILREYVASDDSDHYQVFSNDDLTIEVTYSGGNCVDDSDEEDASDIWNVKEWIVTRIEIEPIKPISLWNARINLSTLNKEPRYPESNSFFVFHNKFAGVAVKTSEDGIENLIFFPSRMNKGKLCRNATAARGFYIRKGWFSLAKPYDFVCVLKNIPANIQEMNLSTDEIEATSNTTISVETVATDAENDVLTYSYKISAGKIIGQGSRVEWDLSDVSAGTYSITAGVDDGAGIVGKTITKTITVK